MLKVFSGVINATKKLIKSGSTAAEVNWFIENIIKFNRLPDVKKVHFPFK